MIPMVTCSRERRLTIGSGAMRTSRQSENHVPAARAPPLRPIYRRLGANWEEGRCYGARFSNWEIYC